MTAKFDITTDPMFNDDEVARRHFEKLRCPSGTPVCPHFGVSGDAAEVKRDENGAPATTES